MMQDTPDNNTAKTLWEKPTLIEINFTATKTGRTFMDENQNASGALS